MSTERTFFQKMEEFGFFEHIYDHLPEEFTAVFEIARVLEDADSSLAQKLQPVLSLANISESFKRQEMDVYQRDIPTGEEYEADFIRNRRDVARIYSWQFTLPDAIFDQRLAERSLMLPVAKYPVILPVQQAGDGFGYDSSKQKVFILFDTSASMQAHHRIHLAQAILMFFLERNKEEMGYVSLRTFDDHVGEMHTAIDLKSYNALIRYIMRITHLGNGTVLQKALLLALDEIAAMDHLAGAEILIITDGAVALDEALIRSKMDENVKIHAVKIGHSQIYASDKELKEMILSGKAGHANFINDLLTQERELEQQVRALHGHDKLLHVQQALRTVREQLKKIQSELGEEYSKVYGHELARLSDVFIEIDDLNDEKLFGASADEISDLEMLIQQIEEDAEQFFTPEMTKKIAIMHDHIGFLLKYEKDAELVKRLEKLDERLRSLLGSALESEDSRSGLQPDQSDGHSRISIPMTEEDIRDLHFLLEFDSRGGKTQWLLLLRYLRKFALRGIKKVFSARIRLKLPETLKRGSRRSS